MDNKVENKKASVFSVSNILYACVVVIALAAVIVIAVTGGAKPIDIPDENGEADYSLSVITDAEICAKSPRFSCKIFGIGIDEDAENADDSVKITAEAKDSFSGVAVLQKTFCEADRVTFMVKCERVSGNLRVVLLDENRSIVHDFTIGESSVFTVENASGKRFELRVAGESAEFTVTSERIFD
jgi:hypothetical protein